jgi:hypothetical protein
VESTSSYWNSRLRRAKKAKKVEENATSLMLMICDTLGPPGIARPPSKIASLHLWTIVIARVLNMYTSDKVINVIPEQP